MADMDEPRRTEPRIDGYPIPGLIRRARRIAGLSQRDMAEVVGVSQSTVQRSETGSLIPSLEVFERIMAAAGLHLVVIDDERHLIEPMEEWIVPMDDRDGVRDGAGRRYPSHLDVVLDPKQGEWWGDLFGFARPPETFYRDPPDLREYRRRLSEWEVRKERFGNRPPPVPPAWWLAAQRARPRCTRPEESRSPGSDAESPGAGGPEVDGWDVDEWDVDEWDVDE
jgi:transcriptional regulator with XRE-family HTH domain